MSSWREALEAEWKRRHPVLASAEPLFPLISQGFDVREIVAAVDSLLTGRITMGARVLEFERAFAEFLNVPHAVMVNSGSSANLLAVAAAGNPLRRKHLRPGDEVIVPAVTWSTSVWPVIQLGYRPVFVDVDPRTLNVSIDDLRRRITPETRGMVSVHILGNASDMQAVSGIANEFNLILLEDTCESLGSESRGQKLGTIGEFGTFSFYYSHHITTGEGGAVICHTQEDADLLRSLRAHGWTRELSNRTEVENAYPDIDPRFLFVNAGFNVRPLEIQAAFGLQQLARVKTMNSTRNENLTRLRHALEAHARWDRQLTFVEPGPGMSPAWFGCPLMLRPELMAKRRVYLEYLSASGVENRPIVSGNFIRQPGLAAFGIHLDPTDYPGAERVHNCGFFIGLHTDTLSDALVSQLAGILLGFDFDR